MLIPTFIHIIPATMVMWIAIPSDPLQGFSWWWGIAISIGYTWLVFGGKRLKEDDSFVISKQNDKSIEIKFTIHIVFLTCILGLMWMVPFILSLLHTSMTGPFRDVRAFVSLIAIVMIGMYFIERKWLYPKSEGDDSDTENDSSESSTTENE